MAGVNKCLCKPNEFTSYLLVLSLDSSDTVNKLIDLITIGENPASFGILCTSLYFLITGLFAVNTKVPHSSEIVSFM